ncbi:helix-turn-helix domain-containing protein [Subtercola endophyticus]|uniref:helix-turn-helix domain-containing protein n=1 Tax=Subtercola endophyticus TaxID=2895559 RepID=UPI001E4A24C9|nr:helix-turn-helix domain-containing protein [Subtercola endophyticus]UFS57705.1 helix-turn-helix domain-containing protein [Subtercola endophyticus]
MRSLLERPEDLGRFVHRIRTDARMTQRQLADALGTSQRYLSELEAGKPKRIDANYFDVLRKLGIELYAETVASDPDDPGND